jgi:hypothetical protein
MESLESRTLLDAVLPYFGGGFKTQFIDGSGGPTGLGDLVTVSLRGPGTGIVHMPNYYGHYDAAMIELHGTTTESVVTITVEGKGATTVGAITTDSSLGGIVAKSVTLTGELSVAGSLGKLVLGGAGGEHTLRLHADPTIVPDPKVQADITLLSVQDLSIQAGDIPIRSLKVGQWLDTPGSAADVIAAPAIGSLKSSGAFEAGLELSGLASAKSALGSVVVSGDLANAYWDVAGNVGKVKLAGWVNDSCLRATGSIAGISVGGAHHSDFMAGISELAARKADQLVFFENPAAAIGSFKVKGLKVPRGQTPPRFFVDSNVSAAQLGAVSLLNVDFNNGSTLFGLYARLTGSGKEIKSVRCADSLDRNLNFTWPPRKDVTFAQRPDLTISLVDNSAPTAQAGDDQTVFCGQQVNLSASGTDPENNPLTYQWTQLSGLSVVLAGSDTAAPSFVAPSVAGQAELVFQVTVRDSGGLTAHDTLTVTVMPIAP